MCLQESVSLCVCSVRHISLCMCDLQTYGSVQKLRMCRVDVQ